MMQCIKLSQQRVTELSTLAEMAPGDVRIEEWLDGCMNG